MSKLNVEQLRVVQARPRVFGGRIGRIVELRDGRVPVVDYDGNPLAPQAARVTALMAERLGQGRPPGATVLLMFEEDDAGRPVIVDVIVPPGAPQQETAEAEQSAGEPAVTAAGERADPAAGSNTARLAVITSVEEDGVLLRYCAADDTNVKAKTAIALRNLRDPVVVLVLANGEAVIIAQVHDRVPVAPDGGESAEVVLKGSRVRIEADVELVLSAGDCKLHLDARGKVATTANQIVSRARDSNKIQGGSVQLN